MHTETEITTAARRVARELNRRSSTLCVAFDADGRVLRTWDADMWAVRSDGGPRSAAESVGRRSQPMTQREAQDLLDAWAHRGAGGDLGQYLNDLELSRARRAGL